MMRRHLASFAVLLTALAPPLAAQGLPKAGSPEEVGFSSTRLKRINERLDEAVEKGDLPGAVVLIVRNGKVVMSEAFGYRDREAKAPMKTDSIFRIASMSKPITTVAAMTLVEEGRLSLGDPVSRYIPAFSETKVATKRQNADGTEEPALEPQNRPMTIFDLMRHTAGLTSGDLGLNLVKQSYYAMKVFDGDQTNEEMVDKLARLALLYQPGTHWEYSMSTDVLGRVIEVVSGQPLDKAIAERVTGPLKMADTGFVVSPDKKDRGARPQKEGTANVGPPIPEITLGSTWKSGGAGLVSTAGDYGRFLQMLANGGELDGMRVISRETVGRMTTDQLPPNIEMGDEMWRLGPFEPSARVGQGYGLGVAVRTDAGRNPLPGSIGEYFWPGAWGTYFWADPREHLFVVFMLQSQTARERYRTVLQELVYQALVN